jgi:hypothetical protein
MYVSCSCEDSLFKPFNSHQDPDLHTQLAVGCVDSLLAHLQDEQTNKLWRAKRELAHTKSIVF